MSTRSEMEICLAVDSYCSTEFRALEPHQLMALKFAGMMNMGVKNLVHMMAAVEGSEHVDYLMLAAIADKLRTAPEQQALLTIVCDGAAALMSALAVVKGGRH